MLDVQRSRQEKQQGQIVNADGKQRLLFFGNMSW
jgi:hypothetical protein